MNFRISFIINDNFSLDFTLRTREQRHRYFGQVNTPASRDLHAPEVEDLQNCKLEFQYFVMILAMTKLYSFKFTTKYQRHEKPVA